MNHQLALKQVALPFKFQYRVLFFDPKEIYGKVNIQVHARRQVPENIGMQLMFPKPAEKICACGCGAPLQGRRTKWATDECTSFAVDVYRIIYGQLDVVKFYLKKYYGYRCKCGRVRKLKVDHVIPIKHGGGGCWLSNYQFLCHDCHVQKTNADFGWKMEGKTDVGYKEAM